MRANKGRRGEEMEEGENKGEGGEQRGGGRTKGGGANERTKGEGGTKVVEEGGGEQK